MISTPYGSLSIFADALADLAKDVAQLRFEGAPHPEELENAPLLRDWSIGAVPVPCLLGRVSHHPILGDRPYIRTSGLFILDLSAGWARTWSRFYRLGTPADILREGGHG